MKNNCTSDNTTKATCKVTNLICLSDSPMPRVVIIGGGFAGLALIEKLKHKEVQVVLLDKNSFHQFQPLFFQAATNALEPGSILFQDAQAFLIKNIA